MDPSLALVESFLESATGTVLLVGAVITAASATLGTVIFLWKKIAGLAGKFSDFFEDWNGVQDRPGVPGRAGVMVRMEMNEERSLRIESEQQSNGGTSMRDAINRIDERSANIESLVRQHMADGRNLLDVGLKNDKNLWDGLEAAGIKIGPYIPLDRDVLDRTSDLYDKLFPGQPPLFGDYGEESHPPDEPEA